MTQNKNNSGITNAFIQFQQDALWKPREKQEEKEQQNQEQQNQEQQNQENVSSNHLFGILRLHIAKTDVTTRPQFIYFKCDISGSMSEPCSDRKMKIAHAKCALINIIQLLADCLTTEIWIQIDAFDNNITRFVEAQRITAENKNTILEGINNMWPRDSTNIEKALMDSKEQIQTFVALHPHFDVTQIFITDGCATCGCEDNAVLAKLVDASYPNVFIGLGSDHSPHTLNALAANKNASYHFIDKIENGGIVYGEVLHGILYPALRNVSLHARNAQLYDYKINEWTSVLEIDLLTSESEKTFHIRCEDGMDTFDVEVDVLGQLVGMDKENDTRLLTTVFPMPSLVSQDGTLDPPLVDLNLYAFRQRTLELLFCARECKDISPLKKQMKTFIEEIKMYMAEFHVERDRAFQNLHDDVVVVLRTLGTSHQYMVSSARGTSNGAEYSYTPGDNVDNGIDSSFPNNIPCAPRKNNRVNRATSDGNSLYLLDPLDLNVFHSTSHSNLFDTFSRGNMMRENATPSKIAVMRSCSSGTQAESLLGEIVLETENLETENLETEILETEN